MRWVLTILVSLLFLPLSAGLNCSVGLLYPKRGVIAGASIKCPQNDSYCVELRDNLANNDLIHIFFCASLTTASSICFQTRYPTSPQDYGSLYGQFCNNEDNCNAHVSAVDSFPTTSETGSAKQCYMGVVVSSYKLSGGFEQCNGLCVTFAYKNNNTHTYGCVPQETRIALLAPSDDSCGYLGDIIACFCTGDLCNVPNPPLTPINSNLSCYVGISYGHEYYGSVMHCQENEACIGQRPYGENSAYYQCIRRDICTTLTSSNSAGNCSFSSGALSSPCCCSYSLCNFNAAQLAPGGQLPPTPNSADNNRNLLCFVGMSYPYPTQVQPLIGEWRTCSGACVITYTSYNYTYYYCDDADACLHLGIPLGTCQIGVLDYTNFCCLINSTVDTTLSTLATTSYITLPPTAAATSLSTASTASRPTVVTTSTSPVPTFSTASTSPRPPGSCPHGWTPSKTISNKCYRTDGIQAASWFLAQANCYHISTDAQLTSIKNGFENSEVADLVQGTEAAWLGLQWSEGAWKWIDGQPTSYSNWAPGEPYANEGCVGMNMKTATWFVDGCDVTYNVVCELYV